MMFVLSAACSSVFALTIEAPIELFTYASSPTISLSSTLTLESLTDHAILRVESFAGALSVDPYNFEDIVDHPYDDCTVPIREGDAMFSGLLLGSPNVYSFSCSGPLDALNGLIQSLHYTSNATIRGTDTVIISLSSLPATSPPDCDPIITDAYILIHLTPSSSDASIILPATMNYTLGTFLNIPITASSSSRPYCLIAHVTNGNITLSDEGISQGGEVIGDPLIGSSALRVLNPHKETLTGFYQRSSSSLPTLLHVGLVPLNACNQTLSICGVVQSETGEGIAIDMGMIAWSGHRIDKRSISSDSSGHWCVFAPFLGGQSFLNITILPDEGMLLDPVINQTIRFTEDSYYEMKLWTLHTSPVESVLVAPEVLSPPVCFGYTGNVWDTGCLEDWKILTDEMIEIVVEHSPIACVLNIDSTTMSGSNLRVASSLVTNPGVSPDEEALAYLKVIGSGSFDDSLMVAAASNILTDANPVGLIWRAFGIKSVWLGVNLQLEGRLDAITTSLSEWVMVRNASSTTSIDINVSIRDANCSINSLY